MQFINGLSYFFLAFYCISSVQANAPNQWFHSPWAVYLLSLTSSLKRKSTTYCFKSCPTRLVVQNGDDSQMRRFVFLQIGFKLFTWQWWFQYEFFPGLADPPWSNLGLCHFLLSYFFLNCKTDYADFWLDTKIWAGIRHEKLWTAFSSRSTDLVLVRNKQHVLLLLREAERQA